MLGPLRTGVFLKQTSLNNVQPCLKAKVLVAVQNDHTKTLDKRPVFIERGRMWWIIRMEIMAHTLRLLHLVVHRKSDRSSSVNNEKQSSNPVYFQFSTNLTNQCEVGEIATFQLPCLFKPCAYRYFQRK